MEISNCKRYCNFDDNCSRKKTCNTTLFLQKTNTSWKESNILEKDNIKIDNSGNVINNKNFDIFNDKNLINYRKKILLSIDEDCFNKKLSNYLVYMIFQYLSMRDLIQCSMVCKRWQKLAYTDVLWKHLNLFRRILDETALHDILSRGVRILSLSESKIRTQYAIKNINNIYTYKLEYLDLTMSMITVNSLTRLLSKCKNLKKLSLESCTLETKCCKEISECTEMSVLNLSMCEGLDFKGISYILQLRSLTELNLAWCSLKKEQVNIICKMLPSTMMRLNISGCRNNMDDHNFSELVLSCPKLVELDISDNTSLTENIIPILINLRNLTRLSLNRCYNITSLKRLDLNRMPNLEYLDIFTFQPKSVPNKLKINKFLFSYIGRPKLEDHRIIWDTYINI